MRALDELFADAQARALTVEVRPGTPAYLAEAAAAARPPVRSSATRPERAGDGPPTQTMVRPAKLVVAPGVAAVAPGDWLIAHLPDGSALVRARSLARELAEVSAQAYEVQRLPDGQAVLIARGVATPEAVSPLLGPRGRTRGALEGAETASDNEILALVNAERLAAWQSEASTGAMLSELARTAPPPPRSLAKTERLVELLRREVADWQGVDARLRARIAEISASPFFRLGRKLGHLRRGLRRRAGRVARRLRLRAGRGRD
jgi:hypothetical protein